MTTRPPLPARPALLLIGALLISCDSVDPPPEVPTCDQACQDKIAFRAVREMMKLAYNLTLQGKPEGKQDKTSPCSLVDPTNGTLRVYGTATANALQGVTEVDLTYEFKGCPYLQKDDNADQNYDIKLTGTLTQKGNFSAQSGAMTAVIIKGTDVTISGTVYDPAVPYAADKCALEMTQNGNDVSGKLCDRKTGFQF